MNRFLLLISLCLSSLLSIVSAAFGQNESNPVINEVRIEFLGVRNVSDEAIRAHIQIREGVELDHNLIDRSVRSLYQTGLFDLIDSKLENLPDNRVNVVFVVQTKFRVSAIRVIGNSKVSRRKIGKEIKSRIGGILDERQVKQDRDAIYEFYLDKGFSRITVDSEIDRDPANGTGIVIFYIDEGRKLKIKRVDFVGNDAIAAKKLRKVMKTRKWNYLSWLLDTGKFDEAVFLEDLENLRNHYRDLGYLDVAIQESDVILDYPSPKKIAITINIDEGREYRVGNVTVKGNTLFATPVLIRGTKLRTGDVFSPEKLGEDREFLQDFYGSVGYLETSVRAERIANISTGNIDLTFNITESERFEVESIKIEGNTKTKSVVILRELALAPGDVFDMVRMKNSEARLKNTQFFEEVNLNPESTNIPGRKNLKISVKEGKTGNFQFGAGFSSLEKGMFFFELNQGNFDLFNWRSLFQGDGQKFRIKLSLGSESNTFIMSFEEPWLFEKRLAVGFELYRADSEIFTTYDELRTGIELYLRKRIFRLWEVRPSYRYEIVDVDFTQNIPSENRTLSKVGLSFLTDTRDSIFFTRRGSRYLFSIEYAGLGGNVKYTKLETRLAKFIPTFDFFDQSISLLLRAGTLLSDADDNVPVYERFYLGGQDDVRGFDYRTIGPYYITAINEEGDEIRIDTPNNQGGQSYGFASIEYNVKVGEKMQLAMFYDFGFVNSDEMNFNPRDYNDSFGFGVRILMMNNPMRIDYGIPIETDSHNEKDGNQIHFSFGTRF